MDGRGIGEAMGGIMKLAAVGFFALLIGIPVGGFFLIRWLWMHLSWN